MNTDRIEISGVPLRRVIKRGSQRADGFFNSRKMNNWIPCESSGERAFVRIAEIDPLVTEIYAQPIKISYETPYGHHSAYPDFAIRIEGLFEFHEIKDADDYADPVTMEKLYWIGRHMERIGFAYSVTLSDGLKPLAQSPAVGALLRRVHSPIPLVVQLAVTRLLADGPQSVGYILRNCGYDVPFHTVEALIAQGICWTDLRQPLHAGSLIFSVEQAQPNRLIQFTPPRKPRRIQRWYE